MNQFESRSNFGKMAQWYSNAYAVKNNTRKAWFPVTTSLETNELLTKKV